MPPDYTIKMPTKHSYLSFYGNHPTATVIIPLFNREKLIENTLDSILAQSWRPIRIIVVDNNSSDRSLEVVERWRRRYSTAYLKTEILSESRQGASAARRKGVEWCAADTTDSDILFFFDSDDIMRPQMIEQVMNEFIADPELELVSWPILINNLDGSERQPPVASKGKELEMHLVHAVYSTQRVAVRRGFHIKTGGWNPSVMVWDDWELGCRYALASPKSKTITTPLADIFSQVESITGPDFSSKAGRWEEILDMTEHYAPSPHWKRLIAYRRAILAAHYAHEGRPDLSTPLLSKALSEASLSPLQRLALRFAFSFTSRGLRGAYRLVAPFL